MTRVLFSSFVALALALAGTACRDSPAEVEPPKPAVPEAGVKSLAEAIGLATNEKPPPPAPPTDADFVKLGAREPDWGLDATDPARDYVTRYILSTQRYGHETMCIHAQPSRVDGSRTIVEARDSDENGCTGTRAVRDTFAVDVAKNRLYLADPAVGRPLGDWPDGSGAETMPGAEPKEGPAMETWNPGLRKAIKALDLAPVRVQFYGRGSYPVISVAGWYGTVTPKATPDQLAAVAKKLCPAAKQFPIGLISQGDRSLILRIQCPEGTHWQSL